MVLSLGNEANGTNNDISIDELAKNIDSNIFEVYDSLPKNTLFILVSGTGKAIQARKYIFFNSHFFFVIIDLI